MVLLFNEQSQRICTAPGALHKDVSPMLLNKPLKRTIDCNKSQGQAGLQDMPQRTVGRGIGALGHVQSDQGIGLQLREPQEQPQHVIHRHLAVGVRLTNPFQVHLVQQRVHGRTAALAVGDGMLQVPHEHPTQSGMLDTR